MKAKFNSTQLQKRRMAFIAEKCIMKGIYLPFSYVKTLEKIMKYGSSATRHYINAANLGDKTFFSNFSSENCISDLIRFNLIKKTKRGVVEINNEFFK